MTLRIRTPIEAIKPRYEFRVWADALTHAEEKVRRLAQPKTTESRESYLISKATDKCNAKTCAELDINVLVAVDRGLEQWKPILKAGFPLERSVIANQAFPSMELPAPAWPNPAYELDAFLNAMAHVDGIAIAQVRTKTRHQFRIGDCAAEYAKITINDVPRDRVAVESVDSDAVLNLVRELGITEANTSYIREIKRVLGWDLQ
jgi:exopolyphosphatase/guanosine-5'-triphosphate,3'-diphosphate pyrophosphatase